MLDERLRLLEDPALFALLTHYAELAREDREAWRDRRMEQESLTPAELTRLHGELLAFGWVELNTGQTPELRPGAVPSCYRATSHGLRALREVLGGAVEPAGV